VYERFIARQPIFDDRLKIFGYELFFRSGPENLYRPNKDAATQVIAESATVFDLRTLTGPARAFINVDDLALLRGAPRLLPADRVVVELLGSVTPRPEIIQACTDLSTDGYAIALDDFSPHRKWEPFLPLATFLKVDFQSTDHESRKAIADRFRSDGKLLIGERIETPSDLSEARSSGYQFFQGFFFCKPVMHGSRTIPANKLIHLQLLDAISQPELSYPQIESLLKQDPSLVYKLLRYLNSPILGLRIEVHGIREAISLLGEKEFRRWMSVVAVTAMSSDKAPELIRTALTRAYFCEEFSHIIGLALRSADLFLMGLLSVTDALLDRPIDQVLADLPISSETRVALCGGQNRFRDVYDILLAYERADWRELACIAKTFPTVEEQVPVCYLAAAGRAGEFTT
jgi:c-di-GMP-related signal transduction protein